MLKTSRKFCAEEVARAKVLIAVSAAALFAGCESLPSTASRSNLPPVPEVAAPSRPNSSAHVAGTATTGSATTGTATTGTAKQRESQPTGSRPLRTGSTLRRSLLAKVTGRRQTTETPETTRTPQTIRISGTAGGASLSDGHRLRRTVRPVKHEEEPPVLLFDDGSETSSSSAKPALFPGDPKSSTQPAADEATETQVKTQVTSIPVVPPAPGASSDSSDESSEPAGSSDDDAPPPPQHIAQLGLGEVLSFAGAQNWAILLADERVREAQAKHDAAKVLWLPSLNVGVGYNKHDGKIQATRGEVIEVSRNSLFVGGGGVTSDAPLTGASGGPARFFVDLSLADAIFRPRSTENQVNASQWARHATFNDTLLEASLAYYEVVRAQQQLALARDNLKLMQQLLEDTKRFESSGKGTKADVSRVEVQVERRKNDVVRADRNLQVASAELARILRIDLEGITGDIAIYAKDKRLVPVELIPAESPLNELTAQAVSNRPEISELYYRSEAARQDVLAEQWRPWIPSLHAGASAGGFGGGTGSNLTNLDGRSDFDVLAIWEIRNLGLGTRAARNEAASLRRQTHLEYHRVRDIIVAEVTKAHAEVNAQRRRLALARQRVDNALEAHKRSRARIRGFVGLPLEALQDVQAVIEARQELLNATVDYNQAQLKLLRAIGRTAPQ